MQLKKALLSHAIEEGTFNTSFKDIVLLVKGKKPDNVLEGIFIYDYRVKAEPKILMAKEGRLFIANSLEAGMLIQRERLLQNFFLTHTRRPST
jgi:lipopolysaccharide export LptBFGC system permease protein LptF